MKIVLTGGPHAGKTTLINALTLRGVRTVPESALPIIEGLVKTLGRDAAREWRLAHMADFQLQVGAAQAQAEEAIGDGSSAFLDRGLLDGLAYCAHYAVVPRPELVALCAAARYDLCVVCELKLPFDARPGSGRVSGEAEARKLEALISETYLRHGVRVARLPMAPIEDRVALLLESVADLG